MEEPTIEDVVKWDVGCMAVTDAAKNIFSLFRILTLQRGLDTNKIDDAKKGLEDQITEKLLLKDLKGITLELSGPTEEQYNMRFEYVTPGTANFNKELNNYLIKCGKYMGKLSAPAKGTDYEIELKF